MSIVSPPPAETLTHKFRQNLEKSFTQSQAQPKKTIFISRVQRFSTPTELTPGPGSYSPALPDKHTLDFRNQKSIDDQLSVPKEHAWISGSDRLSFILPQSSLSRIGPGEYKQISESAENNHSSWAKGKRFGEAQRFASQLGPGEYYSVEKNRLSKGSSIFKSKVPRISLNQVLTQSKTHLQEKPKNPEESHPEEVIRFDEAVYPAHKKVDKLSPMFMSKCERPDIVSQNTSKKIGPGSYGIDKESTKLTYYKTAAPRSGMHYNLEPIEGIKKPKTNEIGPGSYEIQKAKSSEKIGKRQLLGIIFKSERFSEIAPKKFSLPGPGDYMKNRFTMIKQEEIRLKNKGSFVRKPQKTHNFGMAPRATLRNSNAVPFGQYELKYYNIEHKIQKQKEHFQKLKLMEVTLPAFNSKLH